MDYLTQAAKAAAAAATAALVGWRVFESLYTWADHAASAEVDSGQSEWFAGTTQYLIANAAGWLFVPTAIWGLLRLLRVRGNHLAVIVSAFAGVAFTAPHLVGSRPSLGVVRCLGGCTDRRDNRCIRGAVGFDGHQHPGDAVNGSARTKILIRRVTQACATVGVVVLGNAYDYVSRTRPTTVRRLAGRRQTQRARTSAEQRLRDIVRDYDAFPCLTLRLFALEDVCVGGGGWTFASGDDYKVRGTLYATAYYSTQSEPGDVLDEILTVGAHPGSLIPFSHTATPLHGAQESGRLVAPGQTLSWDTSRHAVGEPRPSQRQRSDPPVYRCLREPGDMSVTAMRREYGSVFQLDLNPVEYLHISRHGKASTSR